MIYCNAPTKKIQRILNKASSNLKLMRRLRLLCLITLNSRNPVVHNSLSLKYIMRIVDSSIDYVFNICQCLCSCEDLSI